MAPEPEENQLPKTRRLNIPELIEGCSDPEQGCVIKRVISKESDWIVYISKNNDIRVTSEDDHKYPEEWGKIRSQTHILERIVQRLFRKEPALHYLIEIGWVLARAIDDGNTKNAFILLDSTTESINSEAAKKLKFRYIISSLLATIFLILLILLSVWNRDELKKLGENTFEIMIGAMCGGVGAFLSSFIRSDNFDKEIITPGFYYVVDGVLRIFYGNIAAFFVALAIKGELLFGFINDPGGNNSKYVLYFFCLVAGASELFVPSIIKKIDGSVQ